MDGNNIKLGLIGCGAIAERYLNFLKKKEIKLAAVVDINNSLAKEIKDKYNFEMYTDDYRKILSLVDAVIICLPNFLHAPVSTYFLRNGINVLSEKPMATNEKEARLMIEAADQSKRILYSANVMRFYWSSQEVKKIISQNLRGRILSIIAEQGDVFSWPTKSGFFFDKKKSGGGALIDIGSHVLDLILWWLDGYPDNVSYTDDSFGGVEADAELEMTFDQTIPVSVKVSRIRNLDNVIRVALSEGTIIYRPYDYDRISFIDKQGREEVLRGPQNLSIVHYFEEMVDDFLAAAKGKKVPHIDSHDILPSIALIEQCYLNASNFKFSWL